MKKKYTAKMCDNNMSFEECEYAILRHAIDETENIKGKKQGKKLGNMEVSNLRLIKLRKIVIY